MSSSGIAVTGAGLSVPLGLSVAEVWDRTLRGESAISGTNSPDDSQRWENRSSVPHFDLAQLLRLPKNQKFMSSPVKLLLKAAKEAVAESGLQFPAFDDGNRVAVYVASGRVGPEPYEFFRAFNVARDAEGEPDYSLLGGRAARLIDPYFPLRTLANSGLALLAIEFGIHGPTNNFGHSDVAGFFAIQEAIRDLSEHRCDVAVVGAWDSLLSATTYLTFLSAGLISTTDPSEACRPFDQRSDGLVLGEGAGVIVLERTADAVTRSASILAEIDAFGSGWDNSGAFWPDSVIKGQNSNGSASSGAEPDGAVIEVLGNAGRVTRPGFIVASGVGVPARDRSEAAALTQVLDEGVPVTAFKSLTGYLGAATGIVEVVLAMQALQSRTVPAIARLCRPWPDTRLNFVRSAPVSLSGPASAVVVTRSWTGQCAGIGVASC